MIRSIIILCTIFLVACQPKERLYTAQDLTSVGEFSLGLEGPAVQDGTLYFVNPLKNGTIGAIDLNTNTFEIWIDSLPNGSVANGIRFGSKGQMFLADYANHQVLNIDPATKSISVFAMDTVMNQPNDIAISSTDILYASDPNWSNESGNIWRIDKTGKTELLESNMGTTNGIEVAPGDSILYVNESVQRNIWKYKIDAEGQLSDKQLLIAFPDHGMDGMRTDNQGNIYVARYGKGVIAIVNPQGELLQEVKLTASKPTNIAFGGPDGKTCYVTCQDRAVIESFRTEFAGRCWELSKSRD
ncbi:MAG: SMP-30/gluconolactonase/LRE family protein [Reichenbachiella sp.]